MDSQTDQGTAHGCGRSSKERENIKAGQKTLSKENFLRRYYSTSTTTTLPQNVSSTYKRCALCIFIQEGTCGPFQLEREAVLTVVLVRFTQSSQCHHSHTLTSPGFVVCNGGLTLFISLLMANAGLQLLRVEL